MLYGIKFANLLNKDKKIGTVKSFMKEREKHETTEKAEGMKDKNI